MAQGNVIITFQFNGFVTISFSLQRYGKISNMVHLLQDYFYQ
ncbi:hypothetical protein PREVCOP_04123 [Segatella copri DSM 18205]|uniref:Uncharacterized protein n=1 Tax=Segatella copri DSM 18205 TaxID=537011 RepID=D1PA97_9BACT|nr:hypothetical protein PREVCOP_04123 [Segatella copri DSM 18205]